MRLKTLESRRNDALVTKMRLKTLESRRDDALVATKTPSLRDFLGWCGFGLELPKGHLYEILCCGEWIGFQTFQTVDNPLFRILFFVIDFYFALKTRKNQHFLSKYTRFKNLKKKFFYLKNYQSIINELLIESCHSKVAIFFSKIKIKIHIFENVRFIGSNQIKNRFLENQLKKTNAYEIFTHLFHFMDMLVLWFADRNSTDRNSTNHNSTECPSIFSQRRHDSHPFVPNPVE
jgi:hypothetical protein